MQHRLTFEELNKIRHEAARRIQEIRTIIRSGRISDEKWPPHVVQKLAEDFTNNF